MNKLHIKNYEVLGLALNLHKVLSQKCKNQVINIYPIPRGGIPAAYALKAISPHYYNLVDNVEKAHVCIDDIIDSGKTSDFYYKNHAIRTYALIDKQRQELKEIGRAHV